ncbi:MAG: hypothetical protein JWR26_1560, partial [Pedosphaera sp.]|nr:hypothetical protein [Pedosphaera sp.]
MSFLPIVERELRVAARQRLTFWTRASAAALALLVFGGLQILSGTAGGGYLKAGQIQFSFLKWLSFLFAAVMGIFLTADSLSYEKREGTLGLLFLTDLRGYDVVLGKLISHSLRAFYGLLAALPVLGLTLMVGGVTGPEFCRVMLVICNTLFLSLAIGLFVSSISRDVMKAMNGTVLILLVFMIGLPWVDAMVAARGSKPFLAVLSYASPGYLFATTGAYSLGNYWLCLGIQQLLGWGFLVLACLFAPRFWQQKSAPAKSARTAYFQPILYGSRRSRLKLRRKLLARNPMLWLTLRESRFV